MRDDVRDDLARLSAAIDRWQAERPARFYAVAWAVAFAAAAVALWLSGDVDALSAAMAATGVTIGLALGARLRRRT